MPVLWHPAAEEERDCLLPRNERRALSSAVEKLWAVGNLPLPFPHSSHVGPGSLRELRPRAGRSPWRAFYDRVADDQVILAIGPEAKHDRRGFDRARGVAKERLDEVMG